MAAVVMSQKETRRKYGIALKPIPAIKVYRKDMEHDSNTPTNGGQPQETKSWIVIEPGGKNRLHINTYNGNLGPKINTAELERHPFPTEAKDQKKILKGYSEVALSECPVVVPATTPEVPTVPLETTETQVEASPEVTDSSSVPSKKSKKGN